MLFDGFKHLIEKPQWHFIVNHNCLSVCARQIRLLTVVERLTGSDWGDCTVDLVEHFKHYVIDRENTIYKFTGYVAYVGDDDATPTWTLNDHFIAYFRERKDWYETNESVVESTRISGALPDTFPYICIFERVDLYVSLLWVPLTIVTMKKVTPTTQKHEQVLANENCDAAPLTSETIRANIKGNKPCTIKTSQSGCVGQKRK